MIELQDVTLRVGKRCILDEVSVSISRGSIVGLIGENGSGKTTLLKIIAGLLSPTSGTAMISGKTITRQSASRIAYMADTEDFYRFLTVRELFRFYESQFPDFDMKKAFDIAAFLHVPLEDKLKDLSKGSLGRAKIAVTFGRDADFYLLDEPFSGLDPMVRKDIVKGLIRFTDPDRQTILMSTHEIQEAEPLFDKLLVLKKGSIIAEETVDGIRDQHGMDTTSWLISLFGEVYYKA